MQYMVIQLNVMPYKAKYNAMSCNALHNIALLCYVLQYIHM